MRFLSLLVLAAVLLPATTQAQTTRLLHQPDISAQSVAFAYAGDIWTVPRAGGEARRVTSSPTVEKSPHFSPDGQWLAFSGEYGGNDDVYVVPVDGGEPKRLTWHPAPDEVCGWTPDGSAVVFMSTRTGVPDAEPMLWTVRVEGGLPQAMVVPRALTGSISPDGQFLAYQRVRPWESEMKYYRGGQNQPIRVLDLKSKTASRLPWTDSRDQQPVWLGSMIYFISDRDWTNNLWAYDTSTKTLEQITHYDDYEVEHVGAGGGRVVYEQAGDLHLYDPADGTDHKLDIRVSGDFPWAMPHAAKVSKSLTHPQLSPTGVRALFEARGEVITVPTDKGTWRNLTRTSGVADRVPVWSPDGKEIAWFSDASGEYQLVIGNQDGTASPRTFPLDHPGFIYSPSWSPDHTKILYEDAQTNLWFIDTSNGKLKRIDQDNYTWPDRDMSPSWSPDSRYISYTKRLPGSQFHAVFVYSLSDGSTHQITDGMSEVIAPAWDKSGKYLLFLASTDFGLNTGWLDMSSYDRPVRRGVYLAVLSKSDPSPILPETGDEPEDQAAARDTTKAKPESVHVRIDFDGMSQRIIALDVPARDYVGLQAGKAGQFFYLERVPNREDVLHRYDLEKRKAVDFVPGAAEEYALSFDGKKLLYESEDDDGKPKDRWWVVDAAGEPPKEEKGALETSSLTIDLDPMAEWKQMFDEAWRIERDYLYVTNMNGADWPAMKKRYEVLLPYVRHRVDLTRLLDQMQGELAIGHSFVGGGDFSEARRPADRLAGRGSRGSKRLLSHQEDLHR